jgi:internalin A
MDGRNQLQPLFLLSDEPIGSFSDDRLEMDAFRDIITGTVLGTVGPFTIGVYGKWGEGKTSLLRAAESRLRACATEATTSAANKPGDLEFPYVVPVWFNPWQYESEEHPLVPLVAEIERAVATALIDEAGIRNRYGATTVKILKGIGLAGLSLLRSASIKGKVKLSLPFLADGTVDLGLDGKNFVDGLEKAWERANDKKKSAWRTLVDQSTYLTIFDRLKTVYAELDATRPGAEKRIPRVAVFIDDLDRCQPDKAFELIEAIKLVLGQRGFIFILGLDKKIVDSYVHGLWKDRLRERYDEEAARYLDKIVQLPLYLRKHDKSFKAFVAGLLEKMRAGGVPDDTMQIFKGVKDHLGKSTDFGPRALVRRFNTLLVDQKLRPPADPNDPKEIRDLTPANFLGLCLVQRTLLDYVDHAVVLAIAQNDAFCKQMAELWTAAQKANSPDIPDPTSAMYALLDQERQMQPGEVGPNPQTRLLERRDGAENREHAAWRKFLVKLDPHAPCKYVLGTDHGLRWLSSRVLRDFVTDFVADRPAEIAPAGAGASIPVGSGSAALLTDTPELREQITMIERNARRHLNLAPDAPLDAAAWAKVTELVLWSDPITDAGAAWLARVETGLKNLAGLYLNDTAVTDQGLRELARADTGLKALTALDLDSTKVTDAGVKELARADTGLKALTTLALDNTQVTDAGVKELVRADTGLKALTSLDLSYTAVTDLGVKALARAEAGQKALSSLDLWGTQVTDDGAKELARADGCLKALASLNLGGTQVTDTGVGELARAETGLKALIALDLTATFVTDAGVTELARSETGLKALIRLGLGSTHATDVGVKALARADTGLKALQRLDLSGTQVTDAGVQELARADTGLKALSSLNLTSTPVTDAGVKELARADTGLRSLKSLFLVGTKVTEGGVAALKARFPDITIMHQSIQVQRANPVGPSPT